MKHLKNYNQLFESIVTKLDVSNKKLFELPELSDTLEKLWCFNNLIHRTILFINS